MPRRGSSRYLPATGSEGQTQPGSRGRVLRNKPGIIQKREMDRVEFAALVRTQTAWLFRQGTLSRVMVLRGVERQREGNIMSQLSVGDMQWITRL